LPASGKRDDPQQREYLLRQQLWAIQEELDGRTPNRIALLREHKADLPEDVRVAERELAWLEN
jgi:ATP-dependent Lon protease